MSHSKIICQPVKDSSKRFVLGKAGSTELLAIGLNPSNANEDKLDLLQETYKPLPSTTHVMDGG